MISAFSDEPEIYILDDAGNRLEDCFYVSNDSAALLTKHAGELALADSHSSNAPNDGLSQPGETVISCHSPWVNSHVPLTTA
jgi:hypothetical protein